MQALKKITRAVRPMLIRLVPSQLDHYRIHAKWKKEDPATWPLPNLASKEGLEKYEYSLHSQNGEDGILRYLFSEIGFESRTFLEFGFSVNQNNSLRLMLKDDFSGLFMDGSQRGVDRFNGAAQAMGNSRVQALCKFLSLENLEPTIVDSGLPNEIDLLSIDVDGNDYWFWEGINCISPRIVVIEYNASLGPDLSVTVPYDANFRRREKHPSGMYCSASIKAMQALGKRKGFTFVGCESRGVNAFFVRNDCLTDELKALSEQPIFRPHQRRIERGISVEEQYETIKDLPYETVSE